MQKTILIIEDESIVLRTVEKLLRYGGFKSKSAKTATEALALNKEVSFDYIVSDIQIPGSNGLDIVREIRKNNAALKRPIIPVLFMTGCILESYEIEADFIPHSFFLRKPFEAHELINCIKTKLPTPSTTDHLVATKDSEPPSDFFFLNSKASRENRPGPTRINTREIQR